MFNPQTQQHSPSRDITELLTLGSVSEKRSVLGEGTAVGDDDDDRRGEILEDGRRSWLVRMFMTTEECLTVRGRRKFKESAPKAVEVIKPGMQKMDRQNARIEQLKKQRESVAVW
jgi:hypothetical protein